MGALLLCTIAIKGRLRSGGRNASQLESGLDGDNGADRDRSGQVCAGGRAQER